MSDGKVERSWWRKFSDFLGALDEIENQASHEGLLKRIARLEAIVAELTASNRREGSPEPQHAQDPKVNSASAPAASRRDR